MKNKKIKVQYEFLIEYEHKEHYERFLKELEKSPIFESRGAGTASDNKVYLYNCKRIGGGKIIS